MASIFEPPDAAALWQYRSFYIPRTCVWVYMYGYILAYIYGGGGVQICPCLRHHWEPLQKGVPCVCLALSHLPTLGIPLLAQMPPGGPSFLPFIWLQCFLLFIHGSHWRSLPYPLKAKENYSEAPNSYLLYPNYAKSRFLLTLLGFPCGSAGKNLPAVQEPQEMQVWSLGLGRSPGEGHGNPLQYSCLGNPMDREAWRATVHGVSKSQTRLKRLSMHTLTLLAKVRKVSGLPCCYNESESTWHCRRHGFNPWSWNIPPAKEQLCPCATSTEALAPWSLCSVTREATAVRSPLTATKSKPSLPQLEKACMQQLKTQCNQKFKNKWINFCSS